MLLFFVSYQPCCDKDKDQVADWSPVCQKCNVGISKAKYWTNCWSNRSFRVGEKKKKKKEKEEKKPKKPKKKETGACKTAGKSPWSKLLNGAHVASIGVRRKGGFSN